jgi:hypothetical protein
VHMREGGTKRSSDHLFPIFFSWTSLAIIDFFTGICIALQPDTIPVTAQVFHSLISLIFASQCLKLSTVTIYRATSSLHSWGHISTRPLGGPHYHILVRQQPRPACPRRKGALVLCLLGVLSIAEH